MGQIIASTNEAGNLAGQVFDALQPQTNPNQASVSATFV